MFNKSKDGIHWEPVEANDPVVYRGGASEFGWSFDLDGNLFAVLRNEDGDKTGWGRKVAFAETEVAVYTGDAHLGKWTFKQ